MKQKIILCGECKKVNKKTEALFIIDGLPVCTTHHEIIKKEEQKIRWGKEMERQKLEREKRELEEKNRLEAIRTMKLDDFRTKYQKPCRHWKFDLFKIRCVKCDSDRVEFNSDMHTEQGYYNDVSVEGRIICKCHSCGNAMELNFNDIEE